MKPALHLRLSQQLALTPQLQQAIRLLQLSSVELEMELREALESNPLLELAETGGQDESFEGGGEAPSQETSSSTETASSEEGPSEVRYDYGNGPAPDDAEGMESQDQEPEDLRDHLLWQLNLTPLSPRDRAIGATIISLPNLGLVDNRNPVLVDYNNYPLSESSMSR